MDKGVVMKSRREFLVSFGLAAASASLANPLTISKTADFTEDKPSADILKKCVCGSKRVVECRIRKVQCQSCFLSTKECSTYKEAYDLWNGYMDKFLSFYPNHISPDKTIVWGVENKDLCIIAESTVMICDERKSFATEPLI